MGLVAHGVGSPPRPPRPRSTAEAEAEAETTCAVWAEWIVQREKGNGRDYRVAAKRDAAEGSDRGVVGVERREREREERVPTGVEEVEEGEDDAAGDGRV